MLKAFTLIKNIAAVTIILGGLSMPVPSDQNGNIHKLAIVTLCINRKKNKDISNDKLDPPLGS